MNIQNLQATSSMVFTVTNTNDSGEGSLRWAIEQANNTPGLNQILFNIGDGGVQTINLLSQLPEVSEAVIIDSTTQPGYSGSPLIEINGSAAGEFATGLVIQSGESTVKGLIINNFEKGIVLKDAGNNVIEGNYIGTNVTGTSIVNNLREGILIFDSPNNRIGGTEPSSRNLISGNGVGIVIGGDFGTATGNIVQGNYLGTDISGENALPNGDGGILIFTSNNTVGGLTTGAGNLISGNSGRGVSVVGTQAKENLIQGNFIGTDKDGVTALGNQVGINLEGGSNATSITNNIVSGNTDIALFMATGDNNLIENNKFGTDVTGTASLSNRRGIIFDLGAANSNTVRNNLIANSSEGAGLFIAHSSGNLFESNYIRTNNGDGVVLWDTALNNEFRNNQIQNNSGHGVAVLGDSNRLVANIISGNNRDGIYVDRVAGTEPAIATNVTIQENSIYNNAGLGIDLGGNSFGTGNGVTPNDLGDGDIGANSYQNFPVVVSATASSTETKINGTLNSKANETYRIELFASSTTGSSGYGEGQTYLGFTNVTTDANGNAIFSVNLPTVTPTGQYITATATDPNGNTSEFSQAKAITFLNTSGIIFVNPEATGNNDGTSWANAYKDLQAALADATSGNEIWVVKGTYKPTQGTDRNASFRLKDGVKIYGGFLGSETSLSQRDWQKNVTILSGNLGSETSKFDNSMSVVFDPETSSRETRLDGFTITGGYSTSRDTGAGINSRGSATFANLIVRDNQGIIGGGMASLNGNPLLMDVTFTNNTANESGGGMSIDGSAELVNIKFIGNKAFSSAAGGGGLITFNLNHPGTITVTNSLFYKNEAVRGGGIWSYASSPTITNSTFVENKSSSGYGSGYSNRFYGKPTITNSIFWNNQGGNSVRDETGNDITVTYSIVQGGYAGIGNVNADPLFVDAANGNFQLQENSPAINFGSNNLLPSDSQDLDGDGNRNETIAEDLVGSTRIVHDTVDVGAYEYNQPLSTIHKIAFSAANFKVDENQSVAEVFLTRFGVGDNEVTATLTIADGTATAPQDYTNTLNTIPITFAQGQKTVKVTIPIAEDTLVENDETILLTLSNVNGATLGTRSTAIVTILDNDAPDLVVSSITAPARAIAGEQVEVTWIVKNQGTVAATGTWTDRIFLSGDRTAGNDLSVGQSSFTGTLAPGETIERKQLVTLPIDLSSDRYFVVATDVDNQLNEKLPNEKNNTTVDDQPIRILSSDVPDLVVSSITAPSNALSGEEVEVVWTITNQGEVDATGTWNDRVYLSSDQQAGNDQYLGDFAFTGTIAPGETIERKQKITLPIDLNGDRYFVVTTNFGGQLYESVTNVQNNTTVDDQPMQVTLAPFPNLQVTSVTTPPTAFSSQETVVSWTVTNNGNGATSAPFWYDGVWLSLDSKFDNSDIYLGEVANSNYLRVGESYTNNLTVTLPQGIEDNYHFLVKTDYRNQVYEYQQENDNFGSGALTEVKLTPPPDLQITAVQAPSNAFSGQPVTLSWTVTNNGTGQTLETQWYDQVFLSVDETLDSGDRSLGEFLHNGILNANENYTVTQKINLPVDASGDLFFFVKTDSRNQVYENLFESNNDKHDIPATKISLTPPPDLEIEAVTIPINTRAGTPFTINYKVSNFGSTATSTAAWTDSFYLSADDQFDPNKDIKLGDRTHFGALDLGQSYSEAATFTLSDTTAGSYYVFAIADSNDSVFELNNDNNRGRSLGKVEIVSRPADLAVTATAPLSAESGKATRLQWTVTNLGNGDTVVNSWTDRIIASVNATVGDGDDVVLANINRTGILNIGESYTHNELINLPFDLVGQYQLFAVTDANNAIYEADKEGNNASVALPITVTRQTPDLQLTQINVLNTAESGKEFTISWTGQNLGTGTTNVNYWYDGVYLSQDTVISSDDIFLGNVYHSGALGASSSYTATKTFTLPIDVQGQFHVLVGADNTNQVIEGTLENNNVQAATDKVQVGLGSVPDLAIQSIDAPTTAISGQALTLTWTGINNGAGTNLDWYDAFYLSRDKNFDRSSDIYIGRADHNQGLASGQFYTTTNSFELPRGLSGAYYVFAVADGGDKVYERNGEANNANYDPMPMQVILPPPADLVVTAITPPTTAVAGQAITIDYTVTNQGTEAALGSWEDSVYLSADAQWDINDVLVGKVLHSGDVASGASYSGNLTANLPGVTPGSYYAIVRSDIRNQAPESNETNNTEVSQTQVTIDVPQLQLGTPQNGVLGQGGAVYYRVDVAAGESLLINFDSVSNTAFNELYVSYGEMPTRADFDFGYTKPLEADQRILVPTTKAGTYYIAAYGNSVPEAANYTIEADKIDFAALDKSYGQGGTAGNRTIQINGNKFDRTVTATLKGANGFELAATSYYRVDENKLFATFDLTKVAPGAYDVVIKNAAGGIDVVDDGLEVVTGGGGRLWTDIVTPNAITRPIPGFRFVDHLNYNFSINWFNDGLNDVYTPVLDLNSNDEFGSSMSSILAGEGRYESTFYGTYGKDETPGIFLPGEGQSQNLVTRNSPIPRGYRSDIIYKFDALYQEINQPFDWESIRSDIRPFGVSDAEFEPIFQQVINQVGSTNGDFLEMLSRNANLLPTELGSTSNLQDLLALEYTKAAAALGTSLTGSIFAPDFKVDISGQKVTATNLTTNESFVATSFNDGSFIFDALTPGQYTITFDGGVITNPQEFTVTQGHKLSNIVLNADLGSTVQGTVKLGQTGQLLANLQILISSDTEGASDSLLVTTDSQGRYTLPQLASGTYDVVVKGEGFATYRTQIEVKSLTEQIALNFDLVKGGQLTGTLKDAVSNSLIANGTGIITRVGEEEPVEAFLTDENGNFTVTGLAPGEYTIRVEGASYVPFDIENVNINAEQTTTVNSTLARASTITGQVVDGKGNPVTDVEVRLYSTSGELREFASVDAQGNYKFEGLAAGNYQIKVLNDSIPLSSLNVEVQAGTTITAPNAALPIISTISGTVFNSSGTALGEAQVTLYTADGEQLISTTSNAQGQFGFGVLKPGTYKVTANSEKGIYNVAQVVVSAEGGDVTPINLNPGTRTLQGQVLSPTNNLLANVPVIVQLINEAGSQSLQTTTNELGYFTVSGLTDGTYQVIADPDTAPNDFAPGAQTVTVGGADITGVTVETLERRIWQGVVTKADGTAVQDAEVLVYKAGTNQLVAFRTTDIEGKVNANDLASGVYDVDVIANGYALERLTNVDLLSSNSLSIFTLETGNTILSGKVLSPNSDPFSDELVLAYDTTGKLIGLVQTGVDGSYQFIGLPKEVVSLKVSPFGGTPITSTSIDLSSNHSQLGIDFTVSGNVIDFPVLDINPQAINMDYRLIEPLATRSDSWWYDAFFRTVERLDEPDKPESPECSEDTILYRQALKEWGEIAPAFEDIHDRQSSFSIQGQDTIKTLVLRSSKLVTSIFKAIPGAGTALKALDGALTALDIYRRYDISETISTFSWDKLLNEGVKAVVQTKDAIREADTPTAWVRASNLSFTIFDKISNHLNALKNIQSAIIKPLFEQGGEDLVLQKGLPRLKVLEALNTAKQALGKLLEVGVVIDQYFQWKNAIEIESNKISLEWNKFISSISNYETSVEEANNAIAIYKDALDDYADEYQAENDSYRVREDDSLSGNVIANDLKPHCLDEPSDFRVDRFDAGLYDTRTAHGNVFLQADGTFTYEPDDNYVGSDSFSYEVTLYDPVTFEEIKKDVAVVNIDIVEDCADPGEKKYKSVCHEGSADPNDILGPDGFGEERWISASQPLNYTIRFENDSVLATAPAQVVRITQQLDSDLDFRTFRLGDFGFGDITVDVPDNQAYYQTRLDLTATKGIYVDVVASIDIAKGEAFWELQAIDPTTGEVPSNVLVGFLPPNENGTEGQGFVNYSVKAKKDVPTGTVIDAKAEIIFDVNEPIITPAIFNTLDAGKPTSTVEVLPATSDTPEFLVKWSGTDDTNGSALASFTIYVSDNGGQFTPWLTDTTLTEATYIGKPGYTYSFYSIAEDNAGNLQSLPTTAQASTKVAGDSNVNLPPALQINTALTLDEGATATIANTLLKATDSDNTADQIIYTLKDLPDRGSLKLNDTVLALNSTFTQADINLNRLKYQHDGSETSSDSFKFTLSDGTNEVPGETTFNLNINDNDGEIRGIVWNDINGNAQQDANEPGLVGWSVYLDANNNGQLDTGEISTLTTDGGTYIFSELDPGTYNVAQVVQSGWQQTYPTIDITTTAANAALSIPTLEMISPVEAEVQLNFSAANYRVREDGTAITEIVVTRSGRATEAVTAKIILVDGTAEGCGCVPSSTRTDFNYTPITFTLAANETSKVIPVQNALLGNPNAIRIRNDNKVEGDEYFTIQLTNPTGGATIGQQGSATVTILDDESPSTITVTPDQPSGSTPLQSPGTTTSRAADTNPTNLINLDDFWADSRFANIDGQGYSTVIIDTGIDVDHPFFGADNNGDGIADKIIYQYDFADNDTDASDRNGHGSHVSSIVASTAPDANLISLKVFSDNGTGKFAYLEQALQWVIANANTYNIASVNLSLGDSQNWQTASTRYGIGDEFAALSALNIIPVAAAGNSFYEVASNPGVAYPAADPNTIAVGAVWSGNSGGPIKFSGGATDYTTGADRIASFSQRDATLTDVFAPGASITAANATGGTVTMNGTSQAAPWITGVAVLAQHLADQELNRRLTVSEFRNLLAATGVVINDGDDENDNVRNTGLNFPRVDMLALAEGILALKNAIPDTGTTNPGDTTGGSTSTPTPTSVPFAHTVNLTAGEVLTGIDFGNQKLNEAPVVANPINNQNATEDSPFSFTIPDNSFTDVDGDTLTYTASLENDAPLPSWLTFDGTTFNSIPTNENVGKLNIKLTASDGKASVSDVFELAIANVNDAPTLTGTAATLPNSTEDTAYIINTSDLLQGFSDVDGDTLKVSNLTATNGSLVNNGNSTYTFTPAANFNGSVNLTYNVIDSNGGITPATQSLSILAVNDAPAGYATASLGNGIEDNAYSITKAQLLQGFSDVDSADLLITDFTTNNGSFVENQDGSFTITPTANSNGTVSVTYKVSDGEFKIDASNSFSLNAVNDAPTLENAIADQNATEDTAFTFQIPANTFSDVDAGDVLTYTAIRENGDPLPTWLSFDATTRTFNGTPLNENVGNLSIKVTATDSSNTTASSIFNLAIANTNDAPVLVNAIANQTPTEDTLFNFTFDANTFSDVDAGDSLSYNATLANGATLPSWLSFDAQTRTFSGTPTNGDVGIVSLKVTATDIAGATTEDIFNLEVLDVNDAPVAADDTAITNQNTPVTISAATLLLLSNESDVDGDVLSISAVSNASNGSVELDQNGNVIFTPTIDFNGQATFDYTVSDSNNGTAIGQVTVTVNPANDLPMTLIGDSDNDLLYGGGSNDIIAGGFGNDELFGGDGDDLLRGDLNRRSSGGRSGGNDIIHGGRGNDWIEGKSGNDLLYGDEGNDEISGDLGNDKIWGGLGNDILYGGKGRDTFVLTVGEGTDTIGDFKLGQSDRIGLARGLLFEELSIVQNGHNTIIGFGSETLAILKGVQSSSLTSDAFTLV